MPLSTGAAGRPETRRDEQQSVTTGNSGDTRDSNYHADEISMATTGRHGSAGGAVPVEREHVQVSTSQRMISATWGSLLTSLLGMRCCTPLRPWWG